MRVKVIFKLILEKIESDFWITYGELYMFDRPIFVKLICYCVEREPYKSSTFSN